MNAPTYLLTDPAQRNIGEWNRWRWEHPFDTVDLTGANLTAANLVGANLVGADLTEANLVGADLTEANLFEANLVGADLGGADLAGADLSGTVGINHPDACGAVPIGPGELCSALRSGDTITIWAGCETFGPATDAIDQCRQRITELGGPHEAERLAGLAWAQTRLERP